MKLLSYLTQFCIALFLIAASSVSAGTVFNDVFFGSSTSTMDQAPVPPTANSTSYEFFSGVSGSSASIPQPMVLTLPSATSAVGEIQAMFSTSQIKLATVGDFIDIEVVFQDSGNVMEAGNPASALSIGLFNSGGANPNQGPVMLNTGNTSGGSQNWKGFASMVQQSSSANQIFTRGAQGLNGSTSQNQDLLFNGAYSSQSFNDPVGDQVSSKSDLAANVTLTPGGVYTNYLQIQLIAPDMLSISNQVSEQPSPSNLTGILFNEIGTVDLATFNNATNSFDSFAFGEEGGANASTLRIFQIKINDDIAPVPEPTVAALAVLGIWGLVSAERRKRHS